MVQQFRVRTLPSAPQWLEFHDAKKQGVECVILYFHKKELYSLERVEDGWNKYLNDYSSQKYTTAIKQVLCIVENNIIEYPVQ